MESDYKQISTEETLKRLGTSVKEGLSEREAKRRIREYGYNEIAEKKTPAIIRFLSYFWSPVAWMIEIAAAISILTKDINDLIMICLLLLANAVVGFWQEYKAENVIELLKQKMALKAKVLRNGKWKEIPAKELVPGDIIRLRIGDLIPADAKLIDGEYLTVDESALTGESLPVEKVAGNIVYSGSIVKKGEMDCVVTNTGSSTYFGKTVKLIEEAKTVSSLQKMVLKVGDYLIILALALATIILLVSFYRQESLMLSLKFVLVLIVASIPAAMPAVLSITAAIGALGLAKRQAIVTKLSSIEDLAGVEILCSDKTGTLTKNRLTAGEILPFGKHTKEEVALYGALASREEDRDPIDMAVLSTVEKLKMKKSFEECKQISFVPFDPVKKRTEAEVARKGDVFKVAKGAPQVILELCNVDEKEYEKVSSIAEKIAKNGYRTLAVAFAKDSKNWEFVGLIPLFDPPRTDAIAAVEKIRELGVEIKMLTGDHIAIAKHIAELLHLGKRILSTSEILKKGENKVEALVEKANGFAEVFPEHKYRIVGALQKSGHLVAMTGDGVNDAPALKKANCGIAVAGATDAARAAANVVLLQPGLSIIANAIEESRRIFQRMESYVIYRITETIRILIFMGLSILAFNFYPLPAIMLVLLAVLNDLPILTIAYDNVLEHKKPTRWNVRHILILSSCLGLFGVVSSFLALYIARDVFMLSTALIQTFIFLKLVIAGHSTLFVARTKGPFWKKPYPNYLLIFAIIITDLIATVIAAEGFLAKPIGWSLAGFIWIYALIWMLVNDQVKVFVVKRFAKGQE